MRNSRAERDRVRDSTAERDRVRVCVWERMTVGQRGTE